MFGRVVSLNVTCYFELFTYDVLRAGVSIPIIKIPLSKHCCTLELFFFPGFSKFRFLDFLWNKVTLSDFVRSLQAIKLSYEVICSLKP